MRELVGCRFRYATYTRVGKEELFGVACPSDCHPCPNCRAVRVGGGPQELGASVVGGLRWWGGALVVYTSISLASTAPTSPQRATFNLVQTPRRPLFRAQRRDAGATRAAASSSHVGTRATARALLLR